MTTLTLTRQSEHVSYATLRRRTAKALAMPALVAGLVVALLGYLAVAGFALLALRALVG